MKAKQGRAALVAMAVAAALAAGCSNTITKTYTGGPVTSAPVTPAGVPHSPASALAARLKAAGLPVTHLIVYTAATDPNHEMGRQGGYTSKVAWQDRRAVRIEAQAFSHPSSDRAASSSAAASRSSRPQQRRGPGMRTCGASPRRSVTGTTTCPVPRSCGCRQT